MTFPPPFKVYVLNYLLCPPLSCNTVRCSFFYVFPVKFLGRVVLPYTLCSRSIRNHLSLLWTCISIIRTGGSYMDSCKNFLFLTRIITRLLIFYNYSQQSRDSGHACLESYDVYTHGDKKNTFSLGCPY